MISAMASNATAVDDDLVNGFIEKKVKLVRAMNMSNNYNSLNNNNNNNHSNNSTTVTPTKSSQDDYSNSSSATGSSTTTPTITLGATLGGGGRREIDAADTLVSLANSATNTPTVEYKPFVTTATTSTSPPLNMNSTNHPVNYNSTGQSNSIEILLNTSADNTGAEKTIQLTDLKSIISEKNINSSSSNQHQAENGSSNNNLDLVESACKMLIEQVLKQCPNANLASITIKTSSVPAGLESSSSTFNNPSTANHTTTTALPSSGQPHQPMSTEAKTTFTTIQLSDLKNSGRNLSDELKNSNLNLVANPSISGSVASTPAVNGGSGHAYDTTTLMNNQLLSIKSKYSPTSEDSKSLKKSRLCEYDRSPVALSSPATSQDDYGKRPWSNVGGGSKMGSTLATGRRSKDSELPPDEAKKRQERREKNKEAAARCRKKREDLTKQLTRQTEELNREQENLKRAFHELQNEKNRLEKVFALHEKTCPGNSNNSNVHNHHEHHHHIQQQQPQHHQQHHAFQIHHPQPQHPLQQQQQQTSNLIITTENNVKQQEYASHLAAEHQQQSLLKMKKEDLHEIIKQSTEKKKHIHFSSFHTPSTGHLLPLMTPTGENNTLTSNSSTAALTPMSGFSTSSIESLMSHFEQSAAAAFGNSQSSNTSTNPTTPPRPNNLKISNTTSSLLTPSPVAAYAIMQSLIALNNQQQQQQHQQQQNKDFQNQLSNSYPFLANNTSSSGNIGMLMTPTLPLNTPSALYATLTPMEATLTAFANACNTPSLLSHSTTTNLN